MTAIISTMIRFRRPGPHSTKKKMAECFACKKKAYPVESIDWDGRTCVYVYVFCDCEYVSSRTFVCVCDVVHAPFRMQRHACVCLCLCLYLCLCLCLCLYVYVYVCLCVSRTSPHPSLPSLLFPLLLLSDHFHKTCFKCKECNTTLSAAQVAMINGVPYCRPHFKQLFAAKGTYDFGGIHEGHKTWEKVNYSTIARLCACNGVVFGARVGACGWVGDFCV